VRTAATGARPAFTAVITTDINTDETLIAVQGVNVYFAGTFSPNSHVLPAKPALSSIVADLAADAKAQAARASSPPAS
jgi:hypothetical protein